MSMFNPHFISLENTASKLKCLSNDPEILEHSVQCWMVLTFLRLSPIFDSLIYNINITVPWWSGFKNFCLFDKSCSAVISKMHILNRISSPVDRMSLSDVDSRRIYSATDYVCGQFAIRWTETFYIGGVPEGRTSHRLEESLAQICCMVLTSHFDSLELECSARIGLRVTVLPNEQVGYFLWSLCFYAMRSQW